MTLSFRHWIHHDAALIGLEETLSEVADVFWFALAALYVVYVVAWLAGMPCPGVGQKKFRGWLYRFPEN